MSVPCGARHTTQADSGALCAKQWIDMWHGVTGCSWHVHDLSQLGDEKRHVGEEHGHCPALAITRHHNNGAKVREGALVTAMLLPSKKQIMAAALLPKA
jgi:hypothetical protein